MREIRLAESALGWYRLAFLLLCSCSRTLARAHVCWSEGGASLRRWPGARSKADYAPDCAPPIRLPFFCVPYWYVFMINTKKSRHDEAREDDPVSLTLRCEFSSWTRGTGFTICESRWGRSFRGGFVFFLVALRNVQSGDRLEQLEARGGTGVYPAFSCSSSSL